MNLLQIDFSKARNKQKENDIIKIQIGYKNIQQVQYSKLVSQSKYIRDKYKYSEALKSIQNEINKISEEMNIKEESIKLFIELIQEEKVQIPIENYKDFYCLSEYFDIPNFINELDHIREQELFNDLDFSIQILKDFYTKKHGEEETELTIKIEKYLADQINECIGNPKFNELPISSLFRLFSMCNKQILNQNLLIEFISKSISTYSMLFKFVDFEQVGDDKIEEFLKPLIIKKNIQT